MDKKDLILWGALAVALLLGAWNFAEARLAVRKNRFIDTVTSQRILWIEQLRADIAAFIALAGPRAYDRDGARETAWADRIELGRLKRVIELRLNPDQDGGIALLLAQVFRSAVANDMDPQTEKHLNQLATAGQRLLKAEWETVQDEAENGRLRRRPPAKPHKTYRKGYRMRVVRRALARVGLGSAKSP